LSLKRTLPALRLTKTPLIFVLAQVRVAPIVQIESFLPSIQETVRHQGFPNLVKRKFRITEQPPTSDASAQTEERAQWEYINPDHTCSILVDDSSLVLQTTSYASGEDFLGKLALALNAFVAHAKPTQLLRVGLRYVDLIQPTESHSISDLVSPVLREAPAGVPGEPWVHVWETLRQTSPRTRLLIRYTEQPQGFAFPPDIGPFISLRLPQPPQQKIRFGLLDTDHFHEEVSTFTSPLVLERIGDLHDILDQAFRKLVSPTALQAWE
jgi:uncharacterized protein (TIGR04255 family)